MLSDTEYKIFFNAVNRKAQDEGLDITDPRVIFDIIRRHWTLITDFSSADDYVRQKELDSLRAELKDGEADVTRLKNEIAIRERR